MTNVAVVEEIPSIRDRRGTCGDWTRAIRPFGSEWKAFSNFRLIACKRLIN